MGKIDVGFGSEKPLNTDISLEKGHDQKYSGVHDQS